MLDDPFLKFITFYKKCPMNIYILRHSKGMIFGPSPRMNEKWNNLIYWKLQD